MLVESVGIRFFIVQTDGNVQSFINIRDQRIRQKVDSEISAGLLWPEPLIQLNPKFKPGKSIVKLVNDGILQEECRKVFWRE